MKRLLQSRLFQRFWDFAGAASIRVKVLGIVIGVILLLGIFVILQMRSVLTRTLIAELARQGDAIGDSIAHESAELLATGDLDGLNAYLVERQEHYSSGSHNTLVDYLFVVDQDGQRFGSILVGTTGADAQGSNAISTEHGQANLVADGQIMALETPLPDGLGTLYLGLGMDNIRHTVAVVTLQLLSITLVMIATGFGAAFFLTWILTRPIYDLVEAANAIGQGDFTRRVSRWANDELGELASAFNSMAASLQKGEQERLAREELRERYVTGVILAQENERKRIARELHDSTSQSLTSLLVGLQNAKLVKNGAELDHRIDELRTIVGQTLDEVRTISWRLRPSALDDLGLESALRHYIDDYQKRHGLQVDLAVNGIQRRLPLELETNIYRIVQEGLTNVARHARARRVGVILSHRNHLIRIIVEDDGRGFDPNAVRRQGDSLGLQGIRERAGLFGGRLVIESQPEQGTSLFVEIPFEYTENDGRD